MDYSGNGDYDVNTPFKYEEDDQDHPVQTGGDNRPTHHGQDDLMYSTLDFAAPTPTPQHGANLSTSTSSSHANIMDVQSSIDLPSNSSSTNHIVNSNTGNSVAMETSDTVAMAGNDTVAMETSDTVAMETSQEQPPSSPESDEVPLAARTRTRPSRSTRTKKSFAEINEDEEEEETETKPPKGINLFEDTPPSLVGTQSIFSSNIQKERRANLTKGAKRKKKKEPEFCRFCFTNELSLTKIRSAKLPSHPTTKLTTLVPSVSDVDLCLTEKWTNPSFQLVCDECVLVFTTFYEFRQAVQVNDTLLRRLYCSSKAKSKKPPTDPTAVATPRRGRPPKPRDPSSDDDSDAKSIVSTKSNKSTKRKARSKRKGVTDDEDTDGYLSSVSRASRKSTASRKSGKKKRGGVTSDEETDGYMSSVSRKSTNTGSATKAKKKKRYNSDSDNEDVKSDASDGVSQPFTAYDPAENDSSSSTCEDPDIKQESMSSQPYGIDFKTADDSDIEDAKVGDGLGIVIKKEIDDDFQGESEVDHTETTESHGKRSALEKVLKKNLELMTSNVKAKSRKSYFDIICKNLNKPGIEPVEERGESAVKTETEADDFLGGFDDYVDEKPAKKKRGRKPKPDAEKTPKKGRKKKEAGKDGRKKAKVKREPVSGAEDQSGLEDTDYDPKDFETTAGEESGSETHDAFFDDNMQFKCRFCEDSFKTNDKLLRHYKAIHSQTLETSSLCPHCGFTTKSKAMLNRHIRRKHMNIIKEKVKQVCEICSAEVYHLAVHKRSIHAGLSFPCQYCGKTFPRKGELQFHIKGIHLKHQLEKTYICEFCHKEFTFYNYLRRHMRVHTNEKPYKCKDCGVGFNHNVSLKNHRNKCPKREVDVNTNSNASTPAPTRHTRPPAPAVTRPVILTAVPTSSTLIAEVAAPPPVSVQDTLNSALARVTGRFDAPIYYY